MEDRRKVFIDVREGSWHKGNLHAHSTVSDGKLPPRRVAEMYADRGYSFLAFSEHQIYTNWSCLQQPGFVIIPGMERNMRFGEPRRHFHVNGIMGPRGLRDKAVKVPPEHLQRLPMPVWEGYSTGQRIIDDLKDSGHLVVFNHPNWSFNTFEDLLALDGYFAVEIYNTNGQIENGVGVSTAHWDALLRAGRRVWGIAADDNHNFNKYGEASEDWDSFGGWVMVNASELSRDAVTSALVDGRFYSTGGPEIRYLALDGNRVCVECSPVERVYFVAYFRHGYSRCNRDGTLIESAEYELRGTEGYVRVECVDEQGRTAWSNPIFL